MLIVVAPHAGAWIETEHQKRERLNQFVAPHAGAWIETDNIPEMSSPVTSHPMRVRGLKPVSYLDQLPKILSHPMRVRGLKQEVIQKLQC